MPTCWVFLRTRCLTVVHKSEFNSPCISSHSAFKFCSWYIEILKLRLFLEYKRFVILRALHREFYSKILIKWARLVFVIASLVVIIISRTSKQVNIHQTNKFINIIDYNYLLTLWISDTVSDRYSRKPNFVTAGYKMENLWHNRSSAIINHTDHVIMILVICIRLNIKL